ncbi:sterile alpha motif domain-containing protein 14 [Engraulis encrasicolus]|uniref:sterile alpha motif domain-containing protein 14 n=1 Tax=Engraulis encrasicolus TaxID=184585 RepID=UPI002FD36F0F
MDQLKNASVENGCKEDIFDLTEAVPQTQRLDTSLQKARAQLSARRHRPSRSRLRDSLSSIEDDSLEWKSSQSYSSPLHSSSSPLHCLLHQSTASPDLQSSSPAQRTRAFTFDPCMVGPTLAEVRRRHRPLQSDSSQEALLLTPASSPPQGPVEEADAVPGSRDTSQQKDKQALSKNGSALHDGDKQGAQGHLQQGDHSQSEDDSHDTGTDEPGSPTVLLDKKTKRRFLDLGVTLRRTYGKVRKDRTNRIESTEARPARSSAPSLVPFSWFSERMRGSVKSSSQTAVKADSAVRDNTVSKQPTRESQQSSQPYQSLSLSAEEENSSGQETDGSLLPWRRTRTAQPSTDKRLSPQDS